MVTPRPVRPSGAPRRTGVGRIGTPPRAKPGWWACASANAAAKPAAHGAHRPASGRHHGLFARTSSRTSGSRCSARGAPPGPRSARQKGHSRASLMGAAEYKGKKRGRGGGRGAVRHPRRPAARGEAPSNPTPRGPHRRRPVAPDLLATPPSLEQGRCLPCRGPSIALRQGLTRDRPRRAGAAFLPPCPLSGQSRVSRPAAWRAPSRA